MTPTEVAILAAFIASPLLYSIFDWLRNKITAYFSYRGWQAVFLENDHTYFGKITSVSSNEVNLKEVYYIENDSGEGPISKRLRRGDDFNLTKLGETEVHGPKDHMMMNRSGIVFIENLEDSGIVVRKILEHQGSKKNLKS